jgi:hypothetical protein
MFPRGNLPIPNRELSASPPQEGTPEEIRSAFFMAMTGSCRFPALESYGVTSTRRARMLYTTCTLFGCGSAALRLHP